MVIKMENVLQVKNLTKLYKNGRGVKNVSFEISKGDILGLLGPNGSGKTTTMKAVAGLCSINDGEIKIFGYNIESEFEKAMKNVGCLIESPAFHEYLSAYKNLKLLSRLYDNVDGERIEHVLKVVRLDKYKDDKAGRFSLGMKQRLGLAMALLSQPEFIMLDEPANGLDIEGIIEIREIITRLAQEKGITFLVSSHIASEIEKTCNRVAIIYEGELISIEPTENALRLNPTLEDYFLQKVKEQKGNVVL